MATLHLIRQSAFDTNDFEQCLDITCVNDKVVLLDDACYNVRHPILDIDSTSFPTKELFIIESHAKARGLSVPENITAISMHRLVQLTFELDTVVTWQ